LHAARFLSFEWSVTLQAAQQGYDTAACCQMRVRLATLQSPPADTDCGSGAFQAPAAMIIMCMQGSSGAALALQLLLLLLPLLGADSLPAASPFTA
jgi:hypothetical protein